MLITSLEYSSFIGRIAIGRVHRGQVKAGQQIMLMKRDGQGMVKSRIEKYMYSRRLPEKLKVEDVKAGEICALVGLDGFEISDTVARPGEETRKRLESRSLSTNLR